MLGKDGSRAYRLDLPPSLSQVHNVFNISMLRKYIPNPDHVLDFEPINLDPTLSYPDDPLQILYQKIGDSEIKKSP